MSRKALWSCLGLLFFLFQGKKLKKKKWIWIWIPDVDNVKEWPSLCTVLVFIIKFILKFVVHRDVLYVFQKIGCDRPVNYKKESLKEVLKAEYKVGVCSKLSSFL